MKYLGIDIGTKRVGVAVSDDRGAIAVPHSVLPFDENLSQNILKIIEENKIEGLVVGESKNYQGDDNSIMTEIKQFIEDIKQISKVKIYLEPEFMTSMQAEKMQGKNKMTDASAAAIILQSFLDREQTVS